ncbi:type II secretion system protein GspF [Pseudohongiella acticola]|jgi:general secretion pathway protein F|uniref:General secretion pathway protein F n=1 Tax=Pseudohongiella acticola TaxID=1524254 RepID=A0A1E8CFI5_9GAMM|nr:type II secretion system inner membrane protein GspF [Pseudohongiella acticola]OFE11224.1 type II secretion system protein GspF [Pseudohongiella acticola]
MASFTYQALDADGKRVTGVIEGDGERHVRAQLRAQNVRPLVISSGKAPASAAGFASLFRRQRRLSVAELSLVSRQLASLIQSGLPLDEALQISARQSRNIRVKTLLSQVRSRVLEGHTLAQAMSEHPAAFDRMYCAMVRAGESAGYLGEVMERLAEYTETGQQSRQKLQMALVYPMALLGVSVLVVSLLMTFVVPRLVSMFASSSRELPGLTRALIVVSDFMASGWALLLLFTTVAAVIGFRWRLRDLDARRRWHQFLLHVPLLSDMLRQMDSARFASTLAILLSSGVPLLESVRIAAQVLDNEVMRTATEQLAVRVQEGGSFSKSMRQADVFPPLLVQMAANGEANGTLARQLAYAADNQERELQMRLGTTMALLEPLTIVLMGGLVTLIMLAVLLPIFDINTLI